MGLELTIIPIANYYSEHSAKKSIPNSTKLRFERDYEIFEQIDAFAGGVPTISTQPLPKNVFLFYNKKEIRKNPYGNELTIAFACDMQKIKWPENTHPFNKAIKAYIDALPADTPIVLYWE